MPTRFVSPGAINSAAARFADSIRPFSSAVYDSGEIGFDQNTQSLLGLFSQSAFVHKVGDEQPNARQG